MNFDLYFACYCYSNKGAKITIVGNLKVTKITPTTPGGSVNHIKPIVTIVGSYVLCCWKDLFEWSTSRPSLTVSIEMMKRGFNKGSFL